MMQTNWKSKSKNKVIVEFVSYCLCALIFGGIGLSEMGKIINEDQYVVVPSLILLKVQKIDLYQLKQVLCYYVFHWCSNVKVRVMLFQTIADI